MKYSWDKYPYYKWAAVDANGKLWLYKEKPTIENEMWVHPSNALFIQQLDLPLNFNWKESLQKNPTYIVETSHDYDYFLNTD
jgi:hypothetical protein